MGNHFQKEKRFEFNVFRRLLKKNEYFFLINRKTFSRQALNVHTNVLFNNGEYFSYGEVKSKEILWINVFLIKVLLLLTPGGKKQLSMMNL